MGERVRGSIVLCAGGSSPPIAVDVGEFMSESEMTTGSGSFDGAAEGVVAFGCGIGFWGLDGWRTLGWSLFPPRLGWHIGGNFLLWVSGCFEVENLPRGPLAFGGLILRGRLLEGGLLVTGGSRSFFVCWSLPGCPGSVLWRGLMISLFLEESGFVGGSRAARSWGRATGKRRPRG